MADDSSLFNAQLLTPERVLIDTVASEVILRTGEGDITFLAGSAPVVGTVEPGVVRVTDADGQVQRVAVHGGFVHVEQHVEAGEQDRADGPTPSSGTRVTILAGIAELAEEIDVERARVAHSAAESRVNELGTSGRSASAEGEVADPELVEAQAALTRAEVRLEATEAPANAT
jgi:F-type H+-transporting ATPase subunit epsilon